MKPKVSESGSYISCSGVAGGFVDVSLRRAPGLLTGLDRPKASTVCAACCLPKGPKYPNPELLWFLYWDASYSSTSTRRVSGRKPDDERKAWCLPELQFLKFGKISKDQHPYHNPYHIMGTRKTENLGAIPMWSFCWPRNERAVLVGLLIWLQNWFRAHPFIEPSTTPRHTAETPKQGPNKALLRFTLGLVPGGSMI